MKLFTSNRIIRLLFVCLIFTQLSFMTKDECGSYYPIKEGLEYELTNHNSKGGIDSRTYYKTLSVSSITGGIEALVNQESFNPGGKSTSKQDLKFKCVDGVFSIDLNSLIPAVEMEHMGGLNLKMDPVSIETPQNLKVGDVLKNASMVVKILAGDVQVSSMTISISNRRVTGSESVSVPVGTFNALRLEYDLSIATEVGELVTKKFTNKEWVSAGKGVIKMQTYDEKGNLQSYSEMTKFR